MDKKSKDIQLQYEGFLQTPHLFKNGIIKNLQAFDFKTTKTHQLNLKIKDNLRLGKLVERFVSYELQQNSSIKILAENIQIQQNKLTLGELDCLLLQNEKPIHLEIIYKFYLYDKSAGTSEIEYWIGPNRRDSFLQKVEKLQNKQLPLLYHKQTKSLLDKHNLKAKEITQQVYFKAQLFVPLNDVGNSFELVNNECIVGFYIYQKELQQFEDCKFYIPRKHTWLVKPHTSVDWLQFDPFKIRLNEFLTQQSAPLCWLKKPNGELVKFFVVWW